MSQGANQITSVPPLTGAALVNAANGALAALLTQYSGTVAPSSPSLGQVWVDTSGGTIWLLKTWDGTAWILEGVYDTTTHQFYSAIGGGTATLASNTTVDLGSVNQSQITITGTNTINSFGSTALAGQIKFIRFTGIATITYNGVSLVLPGGGNITTAAGDSAWCVCQGGGNWIVAPYIKADGTAIAGGSGGSASQSVVARLGAFDVWQRLVNAATNISVPASTTFQYVNDGWYMVTGAGQASTISQVPGIAKSSQFAAQIQRNPGQTGTGVMRYCAPLFADEVALLAGSFVALSFTMKEGANQSFGHTVNYTVYAGTGTPGRRGAVAYTGETQVINGGVATTTTAARTVFTSPAIIPAATTQLEIQFSWTPSGTAGANDSFTIDDLNLEIVSSAGAVASAFPRWDYTQQLHEARAVFRLLGGGLTFARLYPALVEAVQIVSIGGVLSPPMKAVPSPSFVGTAGNIKLNDLAVNQDFNGVFPANFSSREAYGIQMQATAATLTQGKTGFVNFVTSANEALFLGCEL